MAFGVAHEEAFAPEIALPEQPQCRWHRSTRIGPVRALAWSVLRQATTDLGRFGHARHVRSKPYLDAYAWVTSGDRRWPYSFLNLCDALQLCPESVRDELIGEVPSPRGDASGSPLGAARVGSAHCRGVLSGNHRP